MYDVDKAIPVPELSRRKYPWDSMELGDSFFVPCEEASREAKILRSCACNRRKRDGHRYIVRQVEGGLRCWRVE